MRPIDFKQSTKVLQRPSTMTDKECASLPVWCDGEQCVSCWKPSFKERVKILFGGKVWLGVLSGKTQPPVFVSGEKVFEEAPIKARITAFLLDCKDFITDAWKTLADATKQPDKRKHFVFGFLISLLFGVFFTFWGGFLASSACGAIKEWWDSKGHGTVEVLDLAFTAFGAACAMPFAFLIGLLVHPFVQTLLQSLF